MASRPVPSQPLAPEPPGAQGLAAHGVAAQALTAQPLTERRPIAQATARLAGIVMAPTTLGLFLAWLLA